MRPVPLTPSPPTTDAGKLAWLIDRVTQLCNASQVDSPVDVAAEYADAFQAIDDDLTAMRTATVRWVIDGGGVAIDTGVKGYIQVPFACTITAATALADQAGSIVVDVWKDTYANYPPTDADSITASAPITISSSTKSTDATLTGWTTAISAGDVLGFNVDSVSAVERVTIELSVVKT
jgi:hypothetical protein